MLKSRVLILLWLGFLLTFPACASRQPPVTIGPEKGEVEVPVKASNFKFEPNNITAYKGEELIFRIENISDTGHNFTIKNPDGNTVQSVPLPPKETTTVKVALTEAGVYEFYCDKPFHSTLGMKGRVEVITEP